MGEMTIRDLHRIEKPREKLVRYGSNRLSDIELLAIILGSGTKKTDVLHLADSILTQYPSSTLENVSIFELTKISGIGVAKAASIAASIEFAKRILETRNEVISSPRDVWNALYAIRSEKKEHLIAILLNARQQVIRQEIISIGIVDASIVHPREVFEPAIRHAASAIILAHNHPSNNSQPSDADIQTTKQIISAGAMLGIAVHDHIIVTSEGYFSFAENDLL